MKRTTISLPDELATAVAHEARRRRTSVSQVAREALAAHLGQNGEPRKLAFAALGRSTDGLNARDAEDYLAANWARDIELDRDR